jgi:soluble lytic murein transglycosylase-like protein
MAQADDTSMRPSRTSRSFLRVRAMRLSDAPTLTPRSRRVATWGLVLLGALLVLDAPPIHFDKGVDFASGEAEDNATRSAVTAALEAHLQDRNSVLSGEEQRRVIEAVMRSSRRYGLDPYLVTAVLLVESDARPWAESGKGAIGLMQVMPYMAENLPLAGNLSTIESNVEAGCYILADNIRRLGEAKGISSYFWGRRIRGVAYLQKVQQARQRVREASAS